MVNVLSGLQYKDGLVKLGKPSLEDRRITAVYNILNNIGKIDKKKFFRVSEYTNY